MRRREGPTLEPVPVDRAQVRALLEEANAARERGESMHRHPALAALGELCGVMGQYAFSLSADRLLTPAELDEMEKWLLNRGGVK